MFLLLLNKLTSEISPKLYETDFQLSSRWNAELSASRTSAFPQSVFMWGRALWRTSVSQRGGPESGWSLSVWHSCVLLPPAWISRGIQASSHCPKTCMLGSLVILSWHVCAWLFVLFESMWPSGGLTTCPGRNPFFTDG